MPHDSQFWKTLSDTGTGIAAALTPIGLAIAAAVRKYRKEHPEEVDAKAESAKRAAALTPADVEPARVQELHEQIDFLKEQLRLSQASVAAKDLQLQQAYVFLDARDIPRPGAG